ncbi:tryptophan--tRNA ligase, mitochondrial [Diachasma alloeum]|uniref:tryptophan--tRNA ligase, mitochondrial n=1 Tax=Diachasma alloeum TaxID=454923 RepID=UPI00073812C8|nr:tryptophan--tRNA ligase, mitochondrial [Diachasma alloeum]
MLSTIRNSRSVFASANRLSKSTGALNRCNSEKARKKDEANYPVRILSGIQPTGAIHLGNYLGAVREWVRYQEIHEDVVWSIVDMHAITAPQDPKELQDNIIKITATLLACGIDPSKSILFQQSSVPMHAELAWVFGSMTTMPRLSQQPQFKEKSEKLKDIPLGLFTYPVLQTADILLYKATHVPVGEDQIQHLQLAQHTAQFFNVKYGNTFPMPEPLINKSSGRIKSLREPAKKMSKSSEYKKSSINLVDPPEVIREYLKKAVTDFTSEVTYDPAERPGVSNLVIIHSILTDKSPQEICDEAQGLNTGQYKLHLADVVIEKLRPIRERYEELVNDPGYLNEVLKSGTDRATEIASSSWSEVKSKIGFSGGILSRTAKEVERKHVTSV